MSSIQIVALVTVKPEYTEALAAQFKNWSKPAVQKKATSATTCTKKSANPTVSYS